MFWITLIRIVIWATFFLLIAQGIGAVIWTYKFYGLYVREHRILEVRIEALERRLNITKEGQK